MEAKSKNNRLVPEANLLLRVPNLLSPRKKNDMLTILINYIQFDSSLILL